jgi:hypothetical protein
MHIQWKYLLSLLCVVSYYCNAGAQAAAPTSGDITGWTRYETGLEQSRRRMSQNRQTPPFQRTAARSCSWLSPRKEASEFNWCNSAPRPEL